MSQCTAQSKQSGERCKRAASIGTTVCRIHGAASPTVKAKVERDRAEREARLAVELWGGRTDIDPATALLELVQLKAAEVQFWRDRVHAIQQDDEKSLTWSTTKEKTGGEDRGITREAKAHVALQLLHKAEGQLGDFAAAALKAGVDERLVKIAESTASQFRTVIEAVLADPRLGITADHDLRTAVITDALRTAVEQ